jgi:Raf kinase inhibitor-like YbhB/YbcL family protein
MRFEPKAFWLSLPLCLLFAVASCGSDDDDGGGGNTGGKSGSGGSGATGGSGGSAGAATGGAGGVAGGSTGGASGSGGSAGSATGGSAGAAAFELTSSAYSEGGDIPTKYECGSATGGTNVSPPLAWTAGPSGTQSYAIVMRDLDFNNGFLHWVMWDIPAATLSLPEDVDQVYEPAVPAGAKQAPFNGNQIGYYGPCSPSSVNTYEITVYALPSATMPGLDENSSKTEATDAIVDAALGSAKLSGES